MSIQTISESDTQVGPQIAEKLDITQITYVEELDDIEDGAITVRRNIGNGWQKVRGQLPVLLTVTADANEPRVAAAKKLMKYKNARTAFEVEGQIKAENPEADAAAIKELAAKPCSELEEKGLLIKQWDLDFIEADLSWCGRDGSPTKVHRIQSVVLTVKESKDVEPTEKGVSEMIHELIKEKTIA